MLMRLKALFLDVDGTITVSRSSYSLSLPAVNALRRVVRKGVVVSLVSSAALPIVMGLTRYIGLNGFSIGETGCLVYSDSTGLVSLTKLSARGVYLDVLNLFREYVDDSWQNGFRLHDFELLLKSKYRSRSSEVVSMLREYVESRYEGFTVDYSGFALHVRPVEADKRRAVLYVLERLGVDPSEAGGVGDSYMDASFLSVLGVSAAVGNADEELKKSVSVVLSKPSGLGVVEFVEKFIGVQC